MADMYTPEEIQEIFQAYNDAIKSGTPISAELAMAMKDAQAGMRQWTNEVNRSWKKLGRSATDLGVDLYKGAKGAGTFGDALETATSAVQALIFLIPGVGIAAKVAAVAIGAFGKAVNVAAKQGDALYKTYQDLNKVGATTAGGIQDVFVNMQKFGYGIEELDKMIAIVAANSETLAKFSLTAADGTNAYASAMQSLVRDPALRALGKTVDDINNTGVAYIRQQTMLGRTQRDIGDSLGAQTKKYIYDLDRLQRLTGTSADALAKQQEEAMAEDAYNIYMGKLEDAASKGDKVAEAQVDKIKETMSMLPESMRKQVAKAIGGDISAQQQLLFVAPSLLNDLRDSTKSTGDTLKTFNTEAKRYKGALGDTYMLNADGMREVGGSVLDLNNAITQTEGYDERNKAAKENARLIDASTKNLTLLDLERMKSRDALQSFVQLGVHPATRALNNLAGVTSKITGMLPGKGPGAEPGAPPAGTAAAVRRGGGAPAPAATGTDTSGLKIKSPESTAGGASSPKLLELARNIQDKLGGDLKHFSAFNDSYHSGTNSKHASGTALDFTITDPSKAAVIADMVRNMPGVSKVLDEYSNPTYRATAGHIHAEVSAQMGGIASGPTSGYRAVLHGTEAIVPLPDGKKIPVEIPGFTANLSDQTNLLSQQLTKLDDLINVMRRQVDVSNKILQRTS